MKIRDRIKEFRRVRADELRPHPKNWRTHPPAQRDALRGVLAEIGFASALVARELADGGLELIDGHLRAETTPDALVPVLILDVSAEEADKLLLTLDPLAALAEPDPALLGELLQKVGTQNESVQAMFDSLREADAGLASLSESPTAEVEPPLKSLWQVVVECADEAQQQALYERLSAEDFSCRVLTL